ncbi:MAG: hypothetical protein VCD00_06575 [Candidatus Hydrogenedentota bacterium]
MKTIITACIAFGSILNAHASDDTLYFNWINSYDEGLRQAKISGKPMLLNFRCVP